VRESNLMASGGGTLALTAIERLRQRCHRAINSTARSQFIEEDWPSQSLDQCLYDVKFDLTGAASYEN